MKLQKDKSLKRIRRGNDGYLPDLKDDVLTEPYILKRNGLQIRNTGVK